MLNMKSSGLAVGLTGILAAIALLVIQATAASEGTLPASAQINVAAKQYGVVLGDNVSDSATAPLPTIDRTYAFAAFTGSNATTAFGSLEAVAFGGVVPPAGQAALGAVAGLRFGAGYGGSFQTFNVIGLLMDLGLQPEEWTVSFGLRQTTSSANGVVFAVLDSFVSTGDSRVLLDAVTTYVRNGTALRSEYAVYSAVYTVPSANKLALLTKQSGSDPVVTEFVAPPLFDGEWHAVGLTMDVSFNAVIGQLYVDGETDFSSRERRQCVQSGGTPTSVAEIPAYDVVSVVNQSAVEFARGGLLAVGALEGSLYGLQFYHEALTQRDLVELGAPWMRESLSVTETFGYVFFGVGLGIGVVLFLLSGYATYTEVTAVKKIGAQTQAEASKKAGKFAGKASGSAKAATSQLMEMRSQASTTANAAADPQVLQQLALIVPLVLGVFQGLSIYFRSWTWPELFRKVMEKIVFVFAFDLTLPELNIPPYVTLVLQLVVVIVAIYGFIRFQQRDERLFKASLGRFKANLKYHRMLKKEQLIVAGKESEHEVPAEKAAELAAIIVDEGRRLDLDELEALGLHPDTAEDALEEFGEPPANAFEAVVLLFGLRAKVPLKHEAVSTFVNQVLTDDWFGEHKDLIVQMAKDAEAGKEIEDIDDNEDLSEHIEKLFNRFQEMSTTMFGRQMQPMQLLPLLDLIITLSTDVRGIAAPSADEAPEAKKVEEGEPGKDRKRSIQEEEEMENDLDDHMQRLFQRLFASLEDLKVLLQNTVPHPPEDGSHARPDYQFNLKDENTGDEWFVVDNTPESLNQLNVLRAALEDMIGEGANTGYSVPSVTIQSLDKNKKGAKPAESSSNETPKEPISDGLQTTLLRVHPSLVRDSDKVFLKFKATMAATEEEHLFVVTEAIYEDGLRCPEHDLPLIPAVENRHFQVKLADHRSPYDCVHRRSLAFKMLRDGKPSEIQPCVNDTLYVCYDDSCCYTVCASCADRSVKRSARLLAKVHKARYNIEHSPAGIVPLILFMILQALLLPVMQNTLLVLTCHPSLWCQFPGCYDDPDLTFIVSVVLSALLLVFFRGGITVIWMRSLIGRRGQLRDVVTSDALWNQFLEQDVTVLSALYRKYEFRFILFEPIYMLLVQLGIALTTTLTEANSREQMLSVGIVESMNGLTLALTNPFIDPIMDALAKLGNVHQVVQLSMMGLHRAFLIEDARSSAAAPGMLAVAFAYIGVVFVVMWRTVLRPLLQARRDTKARVLARRQQSYLADQSNPYRVVMMLKALEADQVKFFGKNHWQVAITVAHWWSVATINKIKWRSDADEDAFLAASKRVVEIVDDAITGVLDKDPKALSDSWGINGKLLDPAELDSFTTLIRRVNSSADEFSDEYFDDDRLLDVAKESRSDLALAVASTNAVTLYGRATGTVEDTDLSDAFLAGADLRNLTFTRVNFSGAFLRDCEFSNSFFKDCKFDRADVRGAKFGMARQSRAKFLRTFATQGFEEPTIRYSSDSSALVVVNSSKSGFSVFDRTTGVALDYGSVIGPTETCNVEMQKIAISPRTPHIAYVCGQCKAIHIWHVGLPAAHSAYPSLTLSRFETTKEASSRGVKQRFDAAEVEELAELFEEDPDPVFKPEDVQLGGKYLAPLSRKVGRGCAYFRCKVVMWTRDGKTEIAKEHLDEEEGEISQAEEAQKEKTADYVVAMFAATNDGECAHFVEVPVAKLFTAPEEPECPKQSESKWVFVEDGDTVKATRVIINYVYKDDDDADEVVDDIACDAEEPGPAGDYFQVSVRQIGWLAPPLDSVQRTNKSAVIRKELASVTSDDVKVGGSYLYGIGIGSTRRGFFSCRVVLHWTGKTDEDGVAEDIYHIDSEILGDKDSEEYDKAQSYGMTDKEWVTIALMRPEEEGEGKYRYTNAQISDLLHPPEREQSFAVGDVVAWRDTDYDSAKMFTVSAKNEDGTFGLFNKDTDESEENVPRYRVGQVDPRINPDAVKWLSIGSNNTLLVCSDGRLFTLKLDLALGEILEVDDKHQKFSDDLALEATAVSDSGTLIGGAPYGSITVYSTELHQDAIIMVPGDATINYVKCSRDGKYLVAMQQMKGSVYSVFVTESGSLRMVPTCTFGGSSVIQSMAFSWDCRRICASSNGSLTLYDLAKKGEASGFYKCILSKEEVMKLHAETGEDDEYDSDEDDEDDFLESDKPAIPTFGAHSDTFALFYNGKMRIVDSKSTTAMVSVDIPQTLTVSPGSGDFVVAGFTSGRIGVFEPDTGMSITQLVTSHSGKVTSIRWLEDGDRFLSCGGSTIDLWDVWQQERMGSWDIKDMVVGGGSGHKLNIVHAAIPLRLFNHESGEPLTGVAEHDGDNRYIMMFCDEVQVAVFDRFHPEKAIYMADALPYHITFNVQDLAIYSSPSSPLIGLATNSRCAFLRYACRHNPTRKVELPEGDLPDGCGPMEYEFDVRDSLALNYSFVTMFFEGTTAVLVTQYAIFAIDTTTIPLIRQPFPQKPDDADEYNFTHFERNVEAAEVLGPMRYFRSAYNDIGEEIRYYMFHNAAMHAMNEKLVSTSVMPIGKAKQQLFAAKLNKGFEKSKLIDEMGETCDSIVQRTDKEHAVSVKLMPRKLRHFKVGDRIRGAQGGDSYFTDGVIAEVNEASGCAPRYKVLYDDHSEEVGVNVGLGNQAMTFSPRPLVVRKAEPPFEFNVDEDGETVQEDYDYEHIDYNTKDEMEKFDLADPDGQGITITVHPPTVTYAGGNFGIRAFKLTPTDRETTDTPVTDLEAEEDYQKKKPHSDDDTDDDEHGSSGDGDSENGGGDDPDDYPEDGYSEDDYKRPKNLMWSTLNPQFFWGCEQPRVQRSGDEGEDETHHGHHTVKVLAEDETDALNAGTVAGMAAVAGAAVGAALAGDEADD